MIILLSPSKTLDFKTETHIKCGDAPLFIKESEKLIKLLRKKKISELMELMDISYNLAEINYFRYKSWDPVHKPGEAKPAFAAFKGDVYEGLKAWELDSTAVEFADKHVRILSGLYGLLKPTDVIMPYRLEMGISIRGRGFNNLYDFWKEKVTKQIKKELKDLEKKVIINLASSEYSKAVDISAARCKVITPFFKEFKNGEYKFITLNGKKARGLMTRYIIDNKISDVEELKLFNYEHYAFEPEQSDNKRWVFVR